MSKLSRDPYLTIGVPYSATASDIKRAYHKLARQHHPDRNVGDAAAATERFKEIGAAYAVLSNPTKRAACDIARVVGARPKERRGRAKAWPKPTKRPERSKARSTHAPRRTPRHVPVPRSTRIANFDEFFGRVVVNTGVGVDLDEPAPADLADDGVDGEFDIEAGEEDAAEDYAAEGGEVDLGDGVGRRRRRR